MKADDEALPVYLEDSKSKLFDYFNENYMKSRGSTPIQTPPQGTTTARTSGSLKNVLLLLIPRNMILSSGLSSLTSSAEHAI